MADYSLTRKARTDLLQIGRYTQRRWGAGQRRKYLDQMAARMPALAVEPGMGAPRDDLREGYRSFRQGRHLIFYRQSGDGILVVRVLHVRMDVRRHLEAE